MIDLAFSEADTAIADSARHFLTAAAPISRLTDENFLAAGGDARLWPKLGDLGWLGMGAAEHHGGSDSSLASQAIFFVEAGRCLVSPALISTVLAVTLASRSDALIIDALVSGQARVGIGNPTGRDSHQLQVFDGLAGAPVLVCRDDSFELYSLPGNVPARPGLDDRVALQVVPLSTLGPPFVTAVTEHSRGLYLDYLTLAAAMMLGIADATCDMSVEYAKTRQQFGRLIGAFQAIKHKCADMAVRAQEAQAAMYFAALQRGAGDPEAPASTFAAWLLAETAAMQNARENIQIHGAMGVTLEYRANFYLKRAQVLSRLSGGRPRRLKELLGSANLDI